MLGYNRFQGQIKCYVLNQKVCFCKLLLNLYQSIRNPFDDDAMCLGIYRIDTFSHILHLSHTHPVNYNKEKE